MDEQERLALEYLTHELGAIEIQLNEHVTTTFRWLMATLFTANGGAIVALLSSGDHLPASLYSTAFFAAGVVLSLLMGVLSTYMAFRAITPVTKVRAKVHQGLITGDTKGLEEELADLVGRQKMTWKKWSPTYAGLGSLACFVTGIGVIAGSILI